MSTDTAPTPATRLLVTGKTGCGKSSRVKEALRGWLAKGVRVVAVDVCDEYSREGVAKHDLVQLGPLRRRVTAAELARNPRIINDARLSLAVVPQDNRPASWARAFLLVERLVRASGKAVVVVDEVGTWTNAANGTDCHRARAALEALATNGRKDGLALVVVGQRAAQIPPNIRSQATEWWAYVQDEALDVEALCERFGREQAEAVSRLPRFEFIRWRDSTHQPTQHKPPALRAITGT